MMAVTSQLIMMASYANTRVQ